MTLTAPTLAIDAMGGDHGISVTVAAVKQVAEAHPQWHFRLVGDESALQTQIASLGLSESVRQKIVLHHAPECVAMDESPVTAMRRRQTSMRLTVDAVKQGQAHGAVSAGNTGALMAVARFVLKTLAEIDRPAICTAIPNVTQGQIYMLDLGANVDCKAEHLQQFAAMGSALAQSVGGIKQPRVALLNIGSEDIKGNEQVKLAHLALQQSAVNNTLNYIGFVEGDGVYFDEVDVVVCDGFVGNIALKTSEGVAKLMRHFLKQSFQQNRLTQLAGLIAQPALRSLKQRIDPRRYNGAFLLGLAGLVVKSHGSADIMAFANAITVAGRAVEGQLLDQLRSQLAMPLAAVQVS